MAGLFPGLFAQLTEGKLGGKLDALGENLQFDEQSFGDILQGLDTTQMVHNIGAAEGFAAPDLLLQNQSTIGMDIDLSLSTTASIDGKPLPLEGNMPHLQLVDADTQLDAEGHLHSNMLLAANSAMPATEEAQLLSEDIDPSGVNPLLNKAAVPAKVVDPDVATDAMHKDGVMKAADNMPAEQVALTRQKSAELQQQTVQNAPVKEAGLQPAPVMDSKVAGSNTALDTSVSSGLKPLTNDMPAMGSGASGGEQFQQQQGQNKSEQLMSSQMLAMERQHVVPEQRFTLAPLSSTAASTSAAPAQLEITTPFGSAGWDKAFQQQIMWMAGKDVQAARIQLHPQSLGAIHVELMINDEQNSVTFHAQNDTTRETLEQALPRLRAMFESQGMNLNDVQVSDSFDAQEQADAFREKYAQQGQGGDGQQNAEQEDDDVNVTTARVVESDNLLDDYV